MGLDFWFNQSHYSDKKRISGEEELNVFKEEQDFDDFKGAAQEESELVSCHTVQ